MGAKKILRLATLICLAGGSARAGDVLQRYNVAWLTQSKNSSESTGNPGKQGKRRSCSEWRNVLRDGKLRRAQLQKQPTLTISTDNPETC